MGKSISGVSFRGGNRIPSLKGGLKIRKKWDFCGFAEKGHLDYYSGSPVCEEKKGKIKGKKGWKEASMKKKMKLVKGLVKDLEEFSQLGFGLQVDCDEGLAGQNDKSKKISEAAEILLAQLKKLRVEEKSTMGKEGKQKCKDQDCESSSSSESSDSECDEVVDMRCFRQAAMVQTIENPKESSLSLPTPEEIMSNPKCCNMILETTLNDNATIDVLNSETPKLNQSNQVRSVSSLMTMAPPMDKRIEVCMGGKCKKLGGPALMEEFQRVMDDDTVVVGCKCMGKCKSAPNVRVMNGENVNDDSVRTPSNPILTGVSLEDVELIVANYLGEEKALGVAA